MLLPDITNDWTGGIVDILGWTEVLVVSGPLSNTVPNGALKIN